MPRNMPKKPPRDPRCPKRNLSAYLLYQNAMREQFKALNPGMTFGQLSKYTSAMYSELSAEEKQHWVQRAEQDKARYLQELGTYTPQPGYDAKGDAIVVEVPKNRKGKPEKDSNAPKRNMSAYLLYQNAMRDQFKRDNPGISFGELSKYTSHMYKNLSSEEMALWEARAQQDRARYEQELALYVPPPGHDAHGVAIEEAKPRRKGKRAAKDPGAPKRASGPYVFFTNEMRPKILAEYPGIKFVDMGRLLGERWRALGPQERKKFEEMSARDKKRFQLEQQQFTQNTLQLSQPKPAPEDFNFHDPTELYSIQYPENYAET